eukprot:3569757-Rhodomonas_salina.2
MILVGRLVLVGSSPCQFSPGSIAPVVLRIDSAVFGADIGRTSSRMGKKYTKNEGGEESESKSESKLVGTYRTSLKRSFHLHCPIDTGCAFAGEGGTAASGKDGGKRGICQHVWYAMCSADITHGGRSRFLTSTSSIREVWYPP